MKTILSGVQAWTKGKIKESTADWNQNDSSADNYIKNRPFYEDKEYVTLLNKTVTITDDNGYVSLDEDFPILTIGDSYTIVLNGVEYECIARRYDSGAFLLGNGEIYGDGNISNGEPFSIDGYDNGSVSGSVGATVENGQLVITRTSTGNFEVDIMLDKDGYGKLGDNKYLVVWADFTNVDFRKACFGLISTEGTKPYRTDDHDRNSDFYYLAEGSDQWQTMSHGGDGCFGTAQSSSVIGKKGYFAFPIEYFKMGSLTMNENTLVTGIYLYADISSNDYANIPFCLDSFMLVDDYTKISK